MINMTLQFEKALNAALIPTAIMTAIAITSSFLGMVPELLCCIGIPLFVVDLLILGWAGFRSVSECKLDIGEGAVAGGIAGLVSSFIGGLINLVISLFFVGLVAGVNYGQGNPLYDSLVSGLGSVAVFIIAVAITTGAGLLMGAIGAWVAKNK
jgi:hypothetical protein